MRCPPGEAANNTCTTPDSTGVPSKPDCPAGVAKGSVGRAGRMDRLDRDRHSAATRSRDHPLRADNSVRTSQSSEGTSCENWVGPLPDELNGIDSVPANNRSPRVLRIIGVVVLVWLIVVVVQLCIAGLSARAGLSSTDALRNIASEDLTELSDSLGGSTDNVDEEHAAEALSRASSDFATAHGQVSSPFVRPLFAVPVLGRQLRSVQALSGAAATTTGEAATAVDELEGILESSTATSSSRLDSIRLAEEALARLRSGLADVDLGPTEGLAAPLANARNRFSEEYNRVTSTLDSTLTAVIGMDEFLSGPTDYLLLAANNAEMRAGSGMYLQAAQLEVEDGSFDTSDFTPTQDLVLPTAVEGIDSDVETNWGVLEPGREWRNINLSPRFDATAATAAEMWKARTGQDVDGVMAVDVVGIKRLLELTGPVTLETGESVSADDVEHNLLVGQYRDFGEDRDARRDRLGEVAKATLEAINEQAISASDLLRAIRDLGTDRHLLMWSPHPAQQDAWESLDTDGQVPADGLMLSVLNRGGNKLDPYLDVTAAMTSETDGDLRHVAVDLTIENVAPADLPRYVAGPYPGSDLVAGEYKGIVALTMPSSAGDLGLSGGVPVAVGIDGPNKIGATEIRVRPGETVTARFEFAVPEAQEELLVLPSARLPPTTWAFGSYSFDDGTPNRIDLTEGN